MGGRRRLFKGAGAAGGAEGSEGGTRGWVERSPADPSLNTALVPPRYARGRGPLATRRCRMWARAWEAALVPSGCTTRLQLNSLHCSMQLCGSVLALARQAPLGGRGRRCRPTCTVLGHAVATSLAFDWLPSYLSPACASSKAALASAIAATKGTSLRCRRAARWRHGRSTCPVMATRCAFWWLADLPQIILAQLERALGALNVVPVGHSPVDSQAPRHGGRCLLLTT